MNAFSNDLRELVAKHIALAPAPRILTLVEQLAGAAAPDFAGPHGPKRFGKISEDGTAWLDGQDGEHVATYDAETKLTWLAAPLPCGDVPWAQAIEEAKKCRALGFDDWRLPTVKEILSIVEYERFDPAVDPDFFKGPYGWTWSATPAKSPSDVAWGVSLRVGASGRNHQADRLQVRAVRAGQALALGL